MGEEKCHASAEQQANQGLEHSTQCLGTGTELDNQLTESQTRWWNARTLVHNFFVRHGWLVIAWSTAVVAWFTAVVYVVFMGL